VGDAGALERSPPPRAGLRDRDPARKQAHHRVLQRGLSFGVSQHLAAIPDLSAEQTLAVPGKVAAGEVHRAGIRRLDPRGNAKQSGAARAPQPPHHGKLAGIEAQADLAQHRPVRALGAVLLDVFECEQGHLG